MLVFGKKKDYERNHRCITFADVSLNTLLTYKKQQHLSHQDIDVAVAVSLAL